MLSIQALKGGDNYWESCQGSCCKDPGPECSITLQNPVDNGEQKFIFDDGKLMLKIKPKFERDSCVKYDGLGRGANQGDPIFLTDSCNWNDGIIWKAKCNL